MDNKRREILFGVIDNDSNSPLFYGQVLLTPDETRKMINVISHQLGFKGAEMLDSLVVAKQQGRIVWTEPTVEEVNQEVDTK